MYFFLPGMLPPGINQQPPPAPALPGVDNNQVQKVAGGGAGTDPNHQAEPSYTAFQV